MPDRPRDALDVDLTDEELLEEVDLLVRLIAAARVSSQHLTQAAVDAILFGRDAAEVGPAGPAAVTPAHITRPDSVNRVPAR